MGRVDRVRALLDRHGTTYAEEVGVTLDDGAGPAELWSWYVACLLMSARISSRQAVRAARAYLRDVGRTVRATARSSWQDRVDVLNANGYARYDESTARMLGQTAEALRERYGGDLRRLRDEADGDPSRIHRLLQQFTGVGRVGADIFCREAQVAWPELYPFVDRTAAGVAAELDLGCSTGTIADLVRRDELPRLLAALVRASLADDLAAVRQERPVAAGDPAEVLRWRTRDELYELARDADVPGRSTMTRDELLDALAG